MVDTASAESNVMKAIVVKLHNATDETQLELRLNDIVYVLEQDDSGWWGGHKEGQDCTGWFPGSCVRELEEEVQEPECETPPTANKIEAQLGQSPVAEESAATVPMLKGCEGLDLQAHPALHQDNRLVASPNRRVSGQAATAVTSPTRQVSGQVGTAAGYASLEAAAGSVALANLQAEHSTMSAIAEDRSREIQRLQGELAEANATRQTEATSTRRQNEDLRHQCQMVEKEKADLQRKVQELGMQLDESATDMRIVQAQVEGMREQLKRSQQESRDSLAESAQLRRRLHDKEAELNDMRQAGSRPVVANPQQPRSSHDVFQPPVDDTRRRLFASTGELHPQILLSGGTPSFAPRDFAQPGCGFDGTALGSESSVASSETARPNSYRQPPQPPALAGSTNRPSPSAQRPLMANSLQRPFRAPPGATSPGAQSPLTKCLSTGDLPPTPPATEQEELPMTSIKDKIRHFEQVARSGTPRRSTVVTEVGRSFISEANTSRVAPQRALSQPRKWEKSPRLGNNTQAPVGRTLPGLDMLEQEELATDDQVNFNMSPMTRHQRHQ